MNIDELDSRLRQAQQDQLDWITSDLADRDRLNPPVAGETRPRGGAPYRIGLVAAALLAAVVGYQAVSRNADDVVDTLDPAVSVSGTTVPATTIVVTTTTAEPNSDPEETDVADQTQGGTTAEADEAASPASFERVAKESCASGFRAPLENATLSYVGDVRGWERKGGLTDEQDADQPYGEWEPNFAELVTVEVVLDEPVLATAVRVAQFTGGEVGGVITIGLEGTAVAIPLSGSGGWAEHTFAEPTPVEQFTISRQQWNSNITELILCVTP